MLQSNILSVLVLVTAHSMQVLSHRVEAGVTPQLVFIGMMTAQLFLSIFILATGARSIPTDRLLYGGHLSSSVIRLLLFLVLSRS